MKTLFFFLTITFPIASLYSQSFGNPIFYRTISDLIEVLLPMVQDEQNDRYIQKSLKDKEALMQEALSFNNNSGYLLEIIAYENYAANGSVTIKGVVDMGIGKTPIETLYHDMLTPKLFVYPPTMGNLRRSNKHSFFIWVELDEKKKNGKKLKYANIPFYEEMYNSALAIKSNLDIQNAMKYKTKLYLINDLVESLNADERRRSKYSEIIKQSNSYSEKLRKLEQLENNLKREIENINDANNFMIKVEFLEKILGIATFIFEAKAIIDENNIQSIDKVKTVEELKGVIGDFKLKSETRKIELENTIKIEKTQSLEYSRRLHEKMKNEKIPKGILQAPWSLELY